ncbi:SH3 domain-containing protein [Methylobacterium iners]|uniref:SH3b domain-containing protein n=1 Tax=Methylobacterium iners TaxID=418707 RepID=A0ABQ4RZM9_9HYPH|nr:SH3 domain-containing protein [Methylobacterium iners]GJD95144.1 hypothetical protein OCOJLMKI_2354 [Methylobacterium iners]
MRATLAALLLAGFIGGAAHAQPQSFRVDDLPPGETLTIREAPDAEAPAVAEVPLGRRLLAFGCTTDTPSGRTWCRVKYGSSLGWARRRYLAPD